MRAVLDNTVLSNFQRIKRINILNKLPGLSGNDYFVTKYVMEEYAEVFDAHDVKLPVLNINEGDFKEYRNVIERMQGWNGLGKGELSCMFCAGLGYADIMATDDKRARVCAEKEGIKLMGTLSVLTDCLRVNLIDKKDAVRFAREMSTQGWWISERLLKKFEKKIFNEKDS